MNKNRPPSESSVISNVLINDNTLKNISKNTLIRFCFTYIVFYRIFYILDVVTMTHCSDMWSLFFPAERNVSVLSTWLSDKYSPSLVHWVKLARLSCLLSPNPIRHNIDLRWLLHVIQCLTHYAEKEKTCANCQFPHTYHLFSYFSLVLVPPI